MEFPDIAYQIISLHQKDSDLREQLVKEGKLFKGYNVEMEALHIENANALETHINQIGYPTKKKVGENAEYAAWIIIQHSISKPDFMRHCAQLLQSEVENGNGDPKNLAYLTDRIARLEGFPQRYGTQFDWDINGELSPTALDDLKEVNKRRIDLGLNTVEEQTVIMRARAMEENDKRPLNFDLRQKEYNLWRKKVGWLN